MFTDGAPSGEKKYIYILLYFIKKVLNKVQMLQEKKGGNANTVMSSSLCIVDTFTLVLVA